MWKGESNLVTRWWALESARRNFSSTSLGEERIFTIAIKLTEERSGASRGGSGGSGGGSVASASFLKFFFVFDLDFDFCKENDMKDTGKNITFTFRIHDHVKIGPNMFEITKGKLSLGARIIQEGGRGNIFKNVFGMQEKEQL
ncbi:hypothetical protein V8G54_009736 [Vigna mungo]|uniref:Uncharacterized protein n=1 Tax=Vigna mungo TaxID=3915 RepID=A0AAQ3NVD5_VIGMU